MKPLVQDKCLTLGKINLHMPVIESKYQEFYVLKYRHWHSSGILIAKKHVCLFFLGYVKLCSKHYLHCVSFLVSLYNLYYLIFSVVIVSRQPKFPFMTIKLMICTLSEKTCKSTRKRKATQVCSSRHFSYRSLLPEHQPGFSHRAIIRGFQWFSRWQLFQNPVVQCAYWQYRSCQNWWNSDRKSTRW